MLSDEEILEIADNRNVDKGGIHARINLVAAVRDCIEAAQGKALIPDDARKALEALNGDYWGVNYEALGQRTAAHIHAIRRALTQSPVSSPASDLTDTARLDFLDQLNTALNKASGTVYGWEFITSHNVNRLMVGTFEADLNDARAHGFRSCRDAIDMKMAEYKIRRESNQKAQSTQNKETE